jgi:hypothetical protein
MAIEIEITPPPQGVYSWRTPFRLDRQAGAFHWIWNALHQSWTLYLLGAEGDLMAGPLSLVPPDDLLAQWRHLPVPPGTLTVVGPVERPGALDFGTVCRLIYTSIA